MSTEMVETACLTPSRRAADTPPYPRSDLSVRPGVPIVQLSKNESAMPLPSRWIDAAAQAASLASAYPDPDCRDLRRAIAETFCLKEQQIFCSAGLMECLQSIALAYLDPGDNVVIPEYAFAFFRNATELAGAQVTLVPERNFQVDIGCILEAVDESTKMVIFANPGNPTGTYLSRQSISQLRGCLPASTLLVVDEAYAEFVREDRYEGLFDLTDSGNVIILRTFSKTYALAGFRVGWAYCPPKAIDYLRRIQVPAIVNSVAQAMAAIAVRDQEYVCSFKREMRAIRCRFTNRLAQLERIAAVESEANFVLLRTRSEAEARSLDSFLRQHGIVLRRQAGVGLGDCLRASIGTEEQMQFVASRIADWCGVCAMKATS
ncbi:MAG: pyridoxal phosphate-dependent aminotransferase [Bryobacteraceae bacterium]